jgi:hypothetical protein
MLRACRIAAAAPLRIVLNAIRRRVAMWERRIGGGNIGDGPAVGIANRDHLRRCRLHHLRQQGLDAIAAPAASRPSVRRRLRSSSQKTIPMFTMFQAMPLTSAAA